MLLLAACARPPVPLQGAYPPLTPSGALQPGTTGERVRWGGVIATTTPRNGETCFEVVSKPLDRSRAPDADGPDRRPLRRVRAGLRRSGRSTRPGARSPWSEHARAPTQRQAWATPSTRSPRSAPRTCTCGRSALRASSPTPYRPTGVPTRTGVGMADGDGPGLGLGRRRRLHRTDGSAGRWRLAARRPSHHATVENPRSGTSSALRSAPTMTAVFACTPGRMKFTKNFAAATLPS